MKVQRELVYAYALPISTRALQTVRTPATQAATNPNLLDAKKAFGVGAENTNPQILDARNQALA